MRTFDYDVSVIIPVYNAEDTLEETIESVLNQAVSEEFKYEILLINDGSLDGSEDICLKYTSAYSFIKYTSHENQGVSFTRNRGLDLAQGKYILFLDADDLIAVNTFQENYDLFEEYKEKSNILAYPLFRIIEGEISPHPRNVNYKVKGLHNVDLHPYLNQTTMNIMIKNLEDKVYFNVDLPYAEDALFNTTMVMRTENIIINNRGAYYYRITGESAVTTNTNPVKSSANLKKYMYECIALFKNEFNKIPKYVQSNILYELNWRLKANALYPRHLSKEAYSQWENEFVDILSYIEVDTVKSQPFMDYYHKVYFLSLKLQSSVYTKSDSRLISYYHEESEIMRINKFELVFETFKIRDNILLISGYIKAPFFNVTDDIKLLVNDLNSENPYDVFLRESPASYYKTKSKVNIFRSFNLELPINQYNLKFSVVYKGISYSTYSYFMNNTAFKDRKNKSFIHENWLLKYSDNPFVLKVEKASKNDKKRINKQEQRHAKNIGYNKVWLFKQFAKKINLGEIWIYNDRPNVFDNGYEQFKYDFNKNDKVKRYYITYESENIDGKFTKEEQKYLVKYGSLKHRLLFAKAKVILTSFQALKEYCPFSFHAIHILNDIFSYEVVYLQHGILHAHTPWIYGKGKSHIDKFVVSSNFEKENLINNYNYAEKDIWETTMPRLSSTGFISKKDTKKILFAPSWRSSFTNGMNGLQWNVSREKLLNSTFFTEIMKFLNSKELNKSLVENDVYIDFKLHPIFFDFTDEFIFESEHIRIVKEDVDIKDYVAFITDFSSYVFDFAFLKIPIFYYVPDYDEFLSGNHTFYKLDLPLEDAFGPFTNNYNEMTSYLIKCIKNNFVIDNKYVKKYDEFFYDTENNKERLYKLVKGV